MSGPQRLLGLLCKLTVAAWVAFYLAWEAPGGGAPPRESAVRLRPVPPEPGSASRPPAATPSEARPVAVGPAQLSLGLELLEGGGAFPALNCSYEELASFREYARSMLSLGARFIAVRNREIVGSVDLESGTLDEPRVHASFSPRARDYAGEPALSPLARAVRSRYGSGAVVMMIVPRSLDAGLFGGIARALSERGERHDEYRELRGRYQRAQGGGLHLRVDRGIRLDGTPSDMDLVFDLSEISRLSTG